MELCLSKSIILMPNIAILINTILTHLHFPHFSDETVFISQKQLLIFMFKVSEQFHQMRMSNRYGSS